MGRLVEKLKLNPDKYDVMQWHTQAVNVTTNLKGKIYLNLPALIAMNSVTVEIPCG